MPACSKGRLTRILGASNNSKFDSFANSFQMRIDWDYLATHLAAVISKAIVTKYYSVEIRYAYHLELLTGCRQSLVEAQRYPEDFNGVYATAPALNETGVTTYAITSNVRAVLLDETNFTQAITVDNVRVIKEAVLDACDYLAGLKDGVIGIPRSCHFEIDRLAFSARHQNSSSCLSRTALEAAKRLYAGPVSSITHQQLNLEGVLPGSESVWPGTYVAQTEGGNPGYCDFAVSFLSHYAFWPDPAEEVTSFTINLSEPTLLARTSKTESLEYTGMADMSKFQQLGGKVIMTRYFRCTELCTRPVSSP
ncbi:tannase-domain-containing protein [Karstenula rhodostoma CBS 690.94]|uniref:Carboxylic ester hydrolase n=1 Tax=Karstenula rhodostoma CBS 690.94 TaxID=1392251 RepID=A0A9P4P557_9PLEO|nr:tannase-domain-containing protein [Karstenula rhodostoma CBS 690.94]